MINAIAFIWPTTDKQDLVTWHDQIMTNQATACRRGNAPEQPQTTNYVSQGHWPSSVRKLQAHESATYDRMLPILIRVVASPFKVNIFSPNAVEVLNGDIKLHTKSNNQRQKYTPGFFSFPVFFLKGPVW